MLRELREQKKMSQGELAEALGVSQQTVSLWENGTPPSRWWRSIAEAVGLESVEERAEFYRKLAEGVSE